MCKVINLFGGPSIGKSGTAYDLASYMRSKGYRCELVLEAARDKIYSGATKELTCQPLLLGEQFYRQYCLMTEVDYIITDAPLLLNLIYGDFGKTASWNSLVHEQFNLFENVNFLLHRNSDIPFEPEGRIHDLDESMIIDQEITDIMHRNKYGYTPIKVEKDRSHTTVIYEYIRKH